jgi:hypothetical protein
MNLKRIYFFIFLVSLITVSIPSWSKSGSHSFGAGFISSNPSQDDIDSLIERANTAAGGISTKSMGGAYEFMVHYQYKFKGSMFALQLRPAYFYQSTKGTGGGSNYNYVLSGFTLFPMFKLTPLENKFIKFYMQIGVGYGHLNGTIDEGPNSISFEGANFGGMAGVGSEFCFVDEHCLTVEGNMRYLPFDRNIASSVTGTMANLTRADKKREVEIDDSDLKTTLSGFQGMIGYIYHF